MNKPMGQNNELPNNKGAFLNRSFDDSTPGPGSHTDRYRWQLGDGPVIRILKSDLKEIKAVILKVSSLEAAVRYIESRNMLSKKVGTA